MKILLGNILHGLATGISFLLNFIINILGIIVSVFEGLREVLIGVFSLGCIFFIFFPFYLMPRRLAVLILLIIFVPILGTPLISFLRYFNYTFTERLYDKANTLKLGRKIGYEKFSDYSRDYKEQEEEKRRNEQRQRRRQEEQERQRQQEERNRRFEEFARNFRYYDPGNFGNYSQESYQNTGYNQGYGNQGYGNYAGTEDLGFKEKYEKSCNVLGVSYDADRYQIKLNYRKLAKKYHPDINKAADATEKFQEINDAYDFLSEENITRYKKNYGA